METTAQFGLVIEGPSSRAGPERMRLLKAIEQAASITGAAKLLGLSYRSAWDSVQELNALYGVSLIEASMGGRGGGGRAFLTSAGKTLKSGLDEIQAELQRAAVRLANTMAAGRSWETSTKWEGHIEAVENGEIIARSSQGVSVVALNTHAAAEVGAKATFYIPPIAVLLTKTWINGTSARNQWRVEVVSREDHGGEARLDLRLISGDRMQAALTKNCADRLGFNPRTPAIALVNATQVLVTLS